MCWLQLYTLTHPQRLINPSQMCQKWEESVICLDWKWKWDEMRRAALKNLYFFFLHCHFFLVSLHSFCWEISAFSLVPHKRWGWRLQISLMYSQIYIQYYSDHMHTRPDGFWKPGFSSSAHLIWCIVNENLPVSDHPPTSHTPTHTS